MKIGVFINCHVGHGGAERRFARAVSQLSEIDNEVYLISNKETAGVLLKKGYISESTNKLTFSGGVLKHGLFYKCYHFLNFYKLFILCLKKDIKHIHYPVDPSIYSFLHFLFFRFLGVGYSVSIVDSSRTDRKDFGIVRWLIWYYSIKYAKGVDFLSEGIKKNMEKVFHLQIYNGSKVISVSPCSFTNYQDGKYSEDKEYDLVMMSRLHEKKGHFLFLDALKYIEKEGRASEIGRVGIFGSGKLEKDILKKIAELEEIKVELSYTDNPFEILSKTKILLSLQDDENYPSQSILEAYSCGAKVIVTNVGESYKVVCPGYGALVEKRPDVLGDSILYELESFDRIGADKIYNVVRSYLIKHHSIDRFVNYFSIFLKSQI
ncbi:glycosyltransferase [Marinobacterium sp. D7]|uniref:glycosyltransferase n=1 Tax=Marinobacterium ramblicola TaxID=2849041 RepID=UPI001C2CD010|nr:glycosyltransferase [Marinobacterium ramblicola]MBV1790189.1 glycosyltransferase [Marinobacterium ramblicola]